MYANMHPMKRTNIHMPPELLQRLDKHCKKTGILRSEFIRRAIDAALKKAKE